MHFLALDLGTTTSRRSGLSKGRFWLQARYPLSPPHSHGFVYDPEEFWQKAVTVMSGPAGSRSAHRPAALQDGESGLLVTNAP